MIRLVLRLGAFALAPGFIAGIAAPKLTTIQDVLYKADGSPFSGVAIVTWYSFQAADLTNVATQSITVPIVNGNLSVRLVPTTDAITTASYSVTYNSDGKVQFAETWAVPPSSTALRLKDVRARASSPVVSPPPLTSLQVSDIAGLSGELAIRPLEGTNYQGGRAAVINSSGAIDGASGNAADCLRVNGTSGPCGGVSGTFIDGETPSGAIDGVNTVFRLVNGPNPPSSTSVFQNGLLLQNGLDYSLSGNQITFTSARLHPGDSLVASYRLSVLVPGISFVDAEVPAGAVDGVNSAFSLLKIPNPASSLVVYRNGLRLSSVADYTVSGSILTFTAAAAPQPGDALQCFYRTSP